MNLSLPLFDEFNDASADAGQAAVRVPVDMPVDMPAAPPADLPVGRPGSWVGEGDDLPPVRQAPGRRLAAPEPAALHAALWRASQLGGGRRAVTPSGFAALDAQLPGQGWPHGELTELLLPQPGIGELRLLAPALAAIGGGEGLDDRDAGSPAAAAGSEGARCVMLFAPPAALSAWALAQQGLSSRHWLVVQARCGLAAGQGVATPLAAGATAHAAVRPAAPAVGAAAACRFPHRAPRTPSGLLPLLPSADLLWALEQALRSGQVGAVLAWLPTGLRADALRRLQLAAQSHDGPVFLFREAQARHRPSAAPLRLGVQPAGVDGLSLRLLKRRGLPLAEPLRLVLPSVLTPHQQARALARQAMAQAERSALAAARTGLASPRASAMGPARAQAR